jgi:hypothetical protein
MSGLRRVVALATLLAAVLSAGAARAQEASGEGSADHALVERLLRETGAERKLSDPAWNEYLLALMAAADRRLRALLSGLHVGEAHWLRVVAWALLGAVAVTLVAIVVRWLVQLWARRRAGRPDEPVTIVEAGSPAASGHPREAWRAEIEARLGLQRIDAALEALWWWFACSLTTGAIDPAWTSRELLQATQRGELRPQAATLDRMIYGSARPGAEEIRRFLRRLEAALP